MVFSPGEIFSKNAVDNTLILSTRAQCVYPFRSPSWTDLRVGFFLSVTDALNNDLTTGLAESITEGLRAAPGDFPWIGIKTNNQILPTNENIGFIGYTTYSRSLVRPGVTSSLAASDAGNGTGTSFWRMTTSVNSSLSANIIDGALNPQHLFVNVQPHFPQDAPTVAAGYATLIMLRIQRPNGTSKTLTVTIKQGTYSSDILFANLPTKDLLEANLENYPTVVQTKTINNMANIPDALYAYWPFQLSRLRIHACGCK